MDQGRGNFNKENVWSNIAEILYKYAVAISVLSGSHLVLCGFFLRAFTAVVYQIVTLCYHVILFDTLQTTTLHPADESTL